MGTPRLLLSTAAITGALAAALAACSTPGSAPVGPGSAAPSTAIRPHVAASPVAYFYTANYNSSDIGQLIFSNDGKISQIAPNYALPGCNPVGVAIDEYENVALVACYTGSVIELAFDQHHALKATSIHPVKVPPTYAIIAPRSGAKNRAYVDGYANGASTVSALAYSKTSLHLLKTYATGGFSDGMAFYTSPAGLSTLLIAASDQSQCGPGMTASGAVEFWAQSAGGYLKEQPPLYTCSTTYNVAVASHFLYFSGPSLLGGYDLVKKKPLPSPSPRWSPGKGPLNNPQAMTAVGPTPPGFPAPAGSNDGYPYDTPYPQIAYAASDGEIAVLDGQTWKPVVSFHVAKGQPLYTHQCQDFANPGDPPSKGIAINGKTYRKVCWWLQGDEIFVYGLTIPYGRYVEFDHFTPGNLPFEVTQASPYSWR